MQDPYATSQSDPVTREAASELTAFRFVKVHTEDPAKVEMADTAGEQVLGIVEADFSEGAEVPVRTAGVKFVEAGAAVSQGETVCTDAGGRAVAVKSDTDAPAGRAMSAAVQAGDRIGILLGS